MVSLLRSTSEWCLLSTPAYSSTRETEADKSHCVQTPFPGEERLPQPEAVTCPTSA